MQKKIEKIFFDFERIAFELVPLDARFYWKRMLVMGLNMLTNSLKILDTSKTEFLELIFFLNEQNTWQKSRPADLSSVSDPLTCWLCISILTRVFLGI